MSWMLARSRPKVRAGWQWPKDTTVAGPLVKPFVHLGDGSPATIGEVGEGRELVIPENFLMVNGGGESWEHMPYTPNWGLDLRIWNPVTGAAAQGFSVYMTNSWAQIGAAFTNVVGVRLFHSPTAGGDTVRIDQFSNTFSFATSLGSVTSPVAFNGNYLRLRIWVDDDQVIRIWLNDTYLGFVMTTDDYRFGPGRRCVRFLNTCLNTVWVTNANGGEANPAIWHYDRPTSFPSPTGTEVFSDTFNRANGAVGNGWTTAGTGTSITANSWGMSTGFPADGNKAITRQSGITNGRLIIEATTGGQHAMQSSRDSSIYFCLNDARTHGLAVNVFSNAIYIARWAGTLVSPTFTDFSSRSVTVPNGALIQVTLYDGTISVSVNGARVAYATGVNDLVPATNQGVGLRVQRGGFVNSHSWNDFRVLAA